MLLKKDPLKRESSEVREVQKMLNKALDNAKLLAAADSSLPSLPPMLGEYQIVMQDRNLRHKNNVPIGWNIIQEDGIFWSETENAVICFKDFFYLAREIDAGVVGDTTYSKLKELSSINSCDIQILGGAINTPQNNKTSTDNYEYIKDLYDAIIKTVQGFPALACDWLSEENTKVQKANKKIVYDFGHSVKNISRDFHVRLISFMKTKNPDLEEAAKKIEKYLQKTKKTSKKKKRELIKKIDGILEKTYKKYEKIKLNPKSILKQLEINDKLKNTGRWTGRIATWFEIAQTVVPLIEDLNSETDTEEWSIKWNKDFGDFVESLIGVVATTIIGAILVYLGVSALVAIVICAIAAAIIHFILSLLRKTTWGAELERQMGNIAHVAIKNFEEWSAEEYKRGSPIFTPGFSGPFR